VAVKICSHAETMRELKLCPGELAVVCITPPGHPVPPPIQQLAGELLHLEFDDIDLPRQTLQPPTAEHVSKALEFAKEVEDLIVCCNAGISRSAGLAYVIECSRVAHPALACGVWDKDRHHPNRMVVRLGGELLGNPEIERQHTKWMNQ